ncbi:hypothetical protein [Actinacidiphila sp. bgisy167]
MTHALLLGLPVLLLGMLLVLSAVEERVMGPLPTRRRRPSPNAPGTHAP